MSAINSTVSSSLPGPAKERLLPAPSPGHDRLLLGARVGKNGGHAKHQQHQQHHHDGGVEANGGPGQGAPGSGSSQSGPRPPTTKSSGQSCGTSLPPVHRRPPSITPRPLKGRPGGKTITASAFSLTSLRDHRQIKVRCPPVAGAYRIHPAPPTEFRFFYERGDFPIAVEHDSRSNRIAWKVEIDKLDYHHYLPLFFDGLSETKFPYSFLARQGIMDMLSHGGHKVVAVIPQLVLPIKKALQTKIPEVVCITLKILQALVHADEMVGEALVPYYRQILPVLQLFKNCNRNIGDGIEYGQRRRENLGDLINHTLELLERQGGPDAFINIKYMVPTYESCVLN